MTKVTEASLIIGCKIPRKYFEKIDSNFDIMVDYYNSSCDSSYPHLKLFKIRGLLSDDLGEPLAIEGWYYERYVIIGRKIMGATSQYCNRIQLSKLEQVIKTCTLDLNKFFKNYLKSRIKVKKPSLYLYTGIVD